MVIVVATLLVGSATEVAVIVTIAALGTAVGCYHTVTFDRKALRLPGFEQM